MVFVVRSLEMPLGHLAFDDTGKRAFAPFWVQPFNDLGNDTVMHSIVFVRGKKTPDR
jgi:hypothetical protein